MTALALAPPRPLEGEVLGPDEGAQFVFSPSAFRRGEARILFLPAGATLADAVRMTGVKGRLRRQHLGVYLADHRIPEKHWARIRPKPGAKLYIRVEYAGGGGGGKNPLRALLQIAVVVAATIFGGPIAAAIGIGGTIGTAVVTFGLVTVGQMLVNQLIPPPQPKKSPWAFDQQAGNPYASLTGIRNAYVRDGPIPRVIGQKRMFPMIGARPYTEMQGKTQYLRMLLLVGYGPLSISDIRIGNTPIAAFKGAEIEIREGWPDDAPVSLYTKNVREESLSIKLDPSTAALRQTDPGTSEVSIDISFPYGLVTYDSEGKRKSRTVTVTVEWSTDKVVWNNARWINPSGEFGTQYEGQIIAKASSNAAEVRSGRFAVTGASDGRYWVRVTRATAAGTDRDVDTTFWTTLRSINTENPVNMTGLAMIALRLQATEQLNGAPDVINCLAHSYLPTTSDGESWSWSLTRNPAWGTLDLLRRRGQSGVTPDNRINIDDFIEWAAACDAPAPNANEPRWTCDFVLEGGSIATNAQFVASHGRAQLVHLDGKHTIARDVRQTVAVQHITPRNSFSYRGSKAFPPIPHALRVTFSNPNRNDGEDEVIVYRDGYSETGAGGTIAASRIDTLPLPGVRSDRLAWREGRYHLKVLEERDEEHSVSMDFEALRCSAGKLVHFAHDTVAIGIESGRIIGVEAGSDGVSGVTMDIAVEMEADVAYALRVRHADFSSSVHMVASDLGGPTNYVRFLTPAAGIAAPLAGDLCTFGVAGEETAEMIVKRVQRGENLTARVILAPAGPAIHDADMSEPPAFVSNVNNDILDPLAAPPNPAVIVRSDETVLLRHSDGTLVDRVEIRVDAAKFGVSKASHWEAEYRLSDSNGDWTSLGRAALSSPLYISPAVQGESYDVRARTGRSGAFGIGPPIVVALAIINSSAAQSEWVYRLNHVCIGKTSVPDAPSGFSVTATLDGVDLAWTLATALDIAGYEIRVGGSSWDDATVLVELTPGPKITLQYALSAVTTFRIKAVDVVGLYSSEVTASSAAANTAGEWATRSNLNVNGGASGTFSSTPYIGRTTTTLDYDTVTWTGPGGQTISVSGGTISGLTNGVKYHVFWDDQNSQLTATNNSTTYNSYYTDVTGRYLSLGSATTGSGGGGGGGGGGGIVP